MSGNCKARFRNSGRFDHGLGSPLNIAGSGGNPGRKEICLAPSMRRRSSNFRSRNKPNQEIKSTKEGLNSIEEFDDLKADFRAKLFGYFWPQK